MTFERLNDHFERALKIDFNPDIDKIIILSDSHKWDRGETDFFKNVESIYLGVLDYYHRNNFKLVLLGDIEEGAADVLQHVLDNYSDTFKKENLFLPNNYFRIYGNHDHDWKKDDVRKKLDSIMGGPITVIPALRLGDQIFVVHGHEGDLFSDELHKFSQIILRLLKRTFEQLIGKKPSAAENSKIRSRRAQLLYEWGKINKKIVIAGHTHLAYFESVSLTRIMSRRIRKLELEKEQLPQAGIASSPLEEMDKAHRIMETHDRFHQLDESLPDDSLPLYFNSGCCKYSDGLTGIETADGVISLIKWTKMRNVAPERLVLASRRLSAVISKI